MQRWLQSELFIVDLCYAVSSWSLIVLLLSRCLWVSFTVNASYESDPLRCTGDFAYTEHGILDRTHLRFFTLRSATRLLERCSYSIESRFTKPYGAQVPAAVAAALRASGVAADGLEQESEMYQMLPLARRVQPAEGEEDGPGRGPSPLLCRM